MILLLKHIIQLWCSCMNRIFINKLDKEFELELCKVNKAPICTISDKYLNSITRSLNDIDKIDLTIPKIIKDGYMNDIINPLWDEIKDERLICLNNKDYFVIKVNDFGTDENEKSITAYSREYKLSKIDIIVEDIVFMLVGKDEENDIYSLNDYMKSETGWQFGHIDDTVRYDISEDGTKTEKIRIQTSVNKRWYDYIKNDICESYNCIATYDTDKKEINLYDINTVAENIQLYLSNDNYIKRLSRTESSENIVTRLTLVGNDEMDIINETVTGYPYLEDYSYFKDNGEMSDELVSHLDKYYEMVAIRTVIWKELVKEKQDKITILTRKKTDLYVIYNEITSLKGIKEAYASSKDVTNEAIIAAEITKKIDEQIILEVEIKKLEEDIENLSNSILEINILCKRETATDENGNIIFNERTLEELKEFIYCETYSNDSFLDVKDLMRAGERELSIKCYPETSYDIDVKNFIGNIESNPLNQHWKGDLGLGDIVILYDEDLDNEVFLYVTDYVQSPNEEDGLKITLSNKKYKDTDIRNIADKIKEGSLAMKTIQRKSYILNETKYNRLNMKNYELDYIGGV